MNATPVKGTHHSRFTYHLLLEAPHRAAPVEVPPYLGQLTLAIAAVIAVADR
jgi:hypothetical protein